MAKQKNSCNLKKLHKELLCNCKGFIARLNKAEETMTAGYVHQQASQMVSSASSGGSITIDTRVDSEDLRILTHAFIIQEWHIFLDNVFAMVIVHKLLHKKVISNFPKMNVKIDFSDVDLSTVSKARNYICDKLKETFSYDPYDEKIDKIKKLVDLKPYITTELPFIKKNVIVRNIFQHQKGVVSSGDLTRLGGSLTLLGDANAPVSFNAGDQLHISKTEIKALYETFHNTTKNLQVIQ